MPDPATPQTLNRYAYTRNNPVRYTDPTGHDICNEEGYCFANGGNKYRAHARMDYWNAPGYKTPTIKTKIKGRNEEGDGGIKTPSIQTIVDLLIPSHFGWRWQAEASGTLGEVVGPGPSATIGLNGLINFNSGEIAFFADYGGEGGGGVGAPVGISVTTGPIIGWGSSTVKDVATGNSAIVSGTSAPDLAFSFSVSAPVEGNNLLKPHVDAVSGQIPTTVYLGGGLGTVYGGVGAGGSHVFASSIIDLYPRLGSVIVDPFP